LTSGRSKQKQPLLVGDRIRTLRKDRNLTQSELAASIGIQQSDLCRIENGEYKVSLETLFKILSIFQMKVAEFFHEEVPPSFTDAEVDFLRDFQKLDSDSKREVWEFVRFKRSAVEEVMGEAEKLPDARRRERDQKKEKE
jgi:transcriptional regulator with XRE-family HTH domain